MTVNKKGKATWLYTVPGVLGEQNCKNEMPQPAEPCYSTYFPKFSLVPENWWNFIIRKSNSADLCCTHTVELLQSVMQAQQLQQAVTPTKKFLKS